MMVFTDNVKMPQANCCVVKAKCSNQNVKPSSFDLKLKSALSVDKKNVAKALQNQDTTPTLIFPFANQTNISLKELVKSVNNQKNSEYTAEMNKEGKATLDVSLDIKNKITNIGNQIDKMAAIISQKNNTQQKSIVNNNVNNSISKDIRIIKNIGKVNNQAKTDDSKNSASNISTDSIKSSNISNAKFIAFHENNIAVNFKINQDAKSNKQNDNILPKLISAQNDGRIKTTDIKNGNKISKDIDNQFNHEKLVKSTGKERNIHNLSFEMNNVRIDKEKLSSDNIALLNNIKNTLESTSEPIVNISLQKNINNTLETQIGQSDFITLQRNIKNILVANASLDKSINQNNLHLDKPNVEVYFNNENNNKAIKTVRKVNSDSKKENNVAKNDKTNIHINNYNKINDIEIGQNISLNSISTKDSILKPKDGKQFLLSGTKPEEIIPRMLNIVKNLSDNSTSQAKLLLKPASLGTVIVDISLKDNIVKLKFRADSHDVVNSLENQIGQLKDKMTLQGLKVETIEVNINQKDYENPLKHDLTDNRKQNDGDKELRQSFLDSFKYNEQENENIISEYEFI